MKDEYGENMRTGAKEYSDRKEHHIKGVEAQSMRLHGKGEELLLAEDSFSAWARHQNHPESFRIFDVQRFIPKDSSLIGLGGRPGHPYFLRALR